MMMLEPPQDEEEEDEEEEDEFIQNTNNGRTLATFGGTIFYVSLYVLCLCLSAYIMGELLLCFALCFVFVSVCKL